MITVKLIGGLGNQLFQYAAGRSLAEKNGVPLLLDASYYAGQELRECCLDRFQISGAIATASDLRAWRSPLQRLRMRAFGSLPGYVKESGTAFQDISAVRSPAYLDGYWQSEKYFANIAPIIRREFSLRDPLSPEAARVAADISRDSSVSLHVRRGDYVTNEKARKNHGLLPLEYYENAIARMSEAVSSPRFFVFSDDIAWARQNLPNASSMTFVEGIPQNYEEQALMSMAKHNIIANSTFGWWGAWLNANPNKIVIAPKKWFGDPSRDSSDVAPPSWITL